MKKIILGLIVGLAALVLIVPLFLPTSYNIERTIEFQTERANIFARIVNLQGWKEWDPWYAMEPDAQYSFEGTPGVVGSTASWAGKKIGTGKQTLTKVVQPEYIETQLEFEGESSAATGYWKFEEMENGTKVVWGMKGDLDYPIGRIFGLFMEGMVGTQFDKGLSSLKNLTEGK